MRNHSNRIFGLTLAASILAVFMGGTAFAKTGGKGWQDAVTEDVPAGTSDFFQHLPCPSGFSADSGGFAVLTSATLGNGYTFTFNGPRLDLSPPLYNEWAWNFTWPAGGAPDGSQIIFNVHCLKGAP